jgi:T5SS/PEP-CTERM-associated repeat protein
MKFSRFLFLTTSLVLSSLVAHDACAVTGGSGTTADPYRIDGKDWDMDSGNYAASGRVQFPDQKFVRLGITTTGNHLTMASASTETSVWAYNFLIGDNAGSSGELHVSGANTSFQALMLVIGMHGDGTLVIENGGNVISGSVMIALNSDSSGLLQVTGKGSFLSASNFISNANKGSGVLLISDGALVVCSSTTPYASNDGIIRLNGGYFAVKGNLTTDKTPEEIAELYHFETRFSAQWRNTDFARLNVTYIKDAAQWSASDLYTTYADKIDLTGYTLISSDSSDYIWADAQPSEKPGWYKSSWFGWFCNDETMNGWTFSPIHGYIYICDGGKANEAYYWDSSAGAWCYTSKLHYPFIYNYTLKSWTCYCEGNYPDRIFYDYSKEKKVPESECGK